MHWKIHSCLISSSRPYEDDSCIDLGFSFLGKEGLNFHVVLGMMLAVIGMIWYGNASSKPGGKERQVYSVPSEKTQKSSQSELDQKV